MSNHLENFYRGDTLTLTLTFTDKITGDPVDITGWDVWLTLKNELSDLDAAAAMQVTLTVPAGPDAVNGIATFIATSEDTAIPVATYKYDFQRVIPGSPPDVVTIVAGKVKCKQDVSLDNT